MSDVHLSEGPTVHFPPQCHLLVFSSLIQLFPPQGHHQLKLQDLPLCPLKDRQCPHLDPLCDHIVIVVGVAPPDVHGQGLQLTVGELGCVKLQLKLLLVVDWVRCLKDNISWSNGEITCY